MARPGPIEMLPKKVARVVSIPGPVPPEEQQIIDVITRLQQRHQDEMRPYLEALTRFRRIDIPKIIVYMEEEQL